MRVALDALAVVPGRKGLGRFQARLATELDTRWSDQLGVTALTAPGFDASVWPGGPTFDRTGLRSRRDLVRSAVEIPAALRRLGPQVFVTTTDRLRVPRHLPVVLYVFEHPAYRSRMQRIGGVDPRRAFSNALTLRWFIATVRRADRIVAASTSTARDLVFFAGADPAKVSVAMPGPLLDMNPSQSSALAERERIVLTFIDRDPRDNGAAIVDAFCEGASKAWQLHVVGATPPAVVEQAMACEASTRIVFHGRLNDGAVAALYRRSSVYLDASLYEGFGAQAAEAITAGLTCVVSGVTSLPEVVGADGFLIDPHQPGTIASALQKLTEQAPNRLTAHRSEDPRGGEDQWASLAAHLVALCQEVARPK